jgi:hypothetical protein
MAKKKPKTGSGGDRAKKETSVIVTVADEGLKDIQKVADQLAQKGMTVERVMPITGVIAGTYPAGKFDALEGVEGIASVEEEVIVKLPPPGAPQ